MRDKAQVWTEQQERLLWAAQEVVDDAEMQGGPAHPYIVDGEIMEALKAIVQEIHDDAVKAISEALAKGGVLDKLEEGGAK